MPIVLGATDCPVLDNGLVRVRYDQAVGLPGFRVDAWDGFVYREQGKMTVLRRAGGVTAPCDTWRSAGLVEYTPERAVVSVTLAASTDPYSRERIFITQGRGEVGATFEVYPALLPDGVTRSDVRLQWTPALSAGVPDLNQGVCKIDSQGSGSWTPGPAGSAVYAATAGTGTGTGNSGLFGGVATLGSTSFAASENWIALLSCPTAYAGICPFQHALVVLQAANAQAAYGNSGDAYGTTADFYQVRSQNAAGYLQCQLRFSPTQSQQVMETDPMAHGSGSGPTADTHASGGTAITSTRTADNNAHVSQASWPNGFLGTYRVFVNMRIDVNSASIYAKTGATTGATRSGLGSTAYNWIDCGEIVANNTPLEIHAWMSGGAGTVFVDRVEAILVQDRARAGAIYSGARDQAQAALAMCRTTPRRPARAPL